MKTFVPFMKLVSAVVIAVFLSTAVVAQSGPGGGPGPGHDDDLLSSGLKFKNPRLETVSSTDLKKGAVYLFEDIKPGVDARLKIEDLVGGAKVIKIDDNSNGLYPPTDNGVRLLSGKPADDGKFKTPSLRNVELTAPYTHDGSVNSLDEMIDIYQRGGRLLQNHPWQGDGKLNPNKHKNITGFPLTADEKRQLIHFLVSLTDTTVLVNPKFQNPFH